MLSHILNENSYHLQSVLVEEGSFTLSSILSLLVEASTSFLAVTISRSFIEIVVPDRPAAESIFLTSRGGSTITELERLVASWAWLLLSIVLDGYPPVSDKESTTCLTINGISLCVSRRSSISILCWALTITGPHTSWIRHLLLVAFPPLVDEIVEVCLLRVPIGIMSLQTEWFMQMMWIQRYALLAVNRMCMRICL